METLKPVAAEKAINLEVTTLEPSILVWADRDKITQVLTNLIGNAIKFTPPHGRVTVSSANNDTDWVRVSVSDTGTGISADQRERIFDKFYQIAENGGPKPKGPVSVLPFPKRSWNCTAGTIWVESEVDKGSTFYFTLPLLGAAERGHGLFLKGRGR